MTGTMYNTTFLGSFYFSRPLSAEELTFLTNFVKSRRMQYNVEKLMDELHGDYGNPFSSDPYGPQGAFFTLQLSSDHPAILDSNNPPASQPSLWCHWVPTDTTLSYNSAQNFHHYDEWLEYLVTHFFTPWGIQLNGAIQWQGEDPDDRGILSMRNNRLFVHYEEGDEGSEGGASDEEEV
jgi:hypothetical protein